MEAKFWPALSCCKAYMEYRQQERVAVQFSGVDELNKRDIPLKMHIYVIVFD